MPNNRLSADANAEARKKRRRRRFYQPGISQSTRRRASDFASFSASSTAVRAGHRARPTRAARMAAVASSSRGPELNTMSTASGGNSPSGADSSVDKLSTVDIAPVESGGIQPTYKLGTVDASGKFAGVQPLWKFGSATGGVCKSAGLKGRLIGAPPAVGDAT